MTHAVLSTILVLSFFAGGQQAAGGSGQRTGYATHGGKVERSNHLEATRPARFFSSTWLGGFCGTKRQLAQLHTPAMSVRYMAEVWGLDLDSSAKLILLAFADHADDEGRAFPSVSRVAWKCGCSERTVQRHISTFKDAGVLVPEAFEGGGARSTIYRLHPDQADQLEAFTSPEGGDTVSPVGVSDCHPRGDTHVTRGVTPMSPEPPYNHQITVKDATVVAERVINFHDELRIELQAEHGNGGGPSRGRSRTEATRLVIGLQMDDPEKWTEEELKFTAKGHLDRDSWWVKNNRTHARYAFRDPVKAEEMARAGRESDEKGDGPVDLRKVDI